MARRVQGHILGNYILHDHLARGGFGSIYRANEIGPDSNILRHHVAIKIMHTFEGRIGTDTLRTFEAKELHGMDFYHSNLITYYNKGDNDTTDISENLLEKLTCSLGNKSFKKHTLRSCKKESGGRKVKFNWIAMPLTEKGSLDDISTKRFESGNPYTLVEAIYILKQIISGIGYLHSLGYFHMDLKPGNVLYFPQDQQWRVSDFGLSGKVENGYARSYGYGTHGWAAPEQFRSPVNATADIFSIGQIFYYLLTGEKQFDFPLVGAPPSPAQLNQQVPQYISDFITKSIEWHPADRYPDIPTFRQHLEEITEELLYIADQETYQETEPDLDYAAAAAELPKVREALASMRKREHYEIQQRYTEDDNSIEEGEGLEEFEEDENEDYPLEEEYDLDEVDASLWGPCSFFTTLYSVHGSVVRYQHSIGNKRYSIYIPTTLLKTYGHGDQNSEYPLELKVSYKEITSDTDPVVYTSDPTTPYWDYKIYEGHSDTFQYRLYVNGHYYRIYVPRVLLEDSQSEAAPEWIRLELQTVD